MTVLAVPTDAPMIAHMGASTLLWLHIGGGTLGMAAGSVAMLTKKGARPHRIAGTAFFAGMLGMTGVGATVSPFLTDGQWVNTVAGWFTLYLVVSAWMTVKRRPGQTGRFEKALLLVPLGVAATAAGLFLATMGTKQSGAYSPAYVMGMVSVLAAACDVRMLAKGGLAGWPRMARHLWRMSLALAIALGSFFLGQQKFLPEAVRGQVWLAAPMLATLALMTFWLMRPPVLKAWRKLAGALRSPRPLAAKS